MPNYCSFEGKIVGKEKNVFELVNYLKAMYEYDKKTNTYKVYIKEDDKEIPCKYHIGYRVFQCEILDIKTLTNGNVVVSVYGGCAWSLKSCMFNDGRGCYMSNNKFNNENSKSLSIPDACKELEVKCELFSTEPGVGFLEHYLIDSDGEVEIDNCFDYQEVDCCFYENYEEFLNDFPNTDITEEEFNNSKDTEEPVIRCEIDISNGFPYVIKD